MLIHFLKKENIQNKSINLMRKKIFNNRSETAFAKANADFCVDLPIRERVSLVLDKRFCWRTSVFDDVND